MSTDPSPAAIWLLPTPFDEQRLGSLIGTLAERSDGRAFPPHVTLCGGLRESPPHLPPALLRLAHRTAPLELEIEGLEQGMGFFEALYLTLAATPQVDRLRRELAALLPRAPRLPRLHLSLAYGELDEAHRQRLAPIAGAHAPEGALRFDRLALASPGAGSWRRIETWRILASFPLSGA